MDVDTINPFIESVAFVFKKMLDCDVSNGQPMVLVERKGTPDIVGIISLSGTVEGIVALSFPVPTALAVVSKMVGVKHKSVDSLIVDGVGELVNIIAGQTYGKFKGHKIGLSLPTVVRGNICKVMKLENAVFVEVPFKSIYGDFSLMIAFRSILLARKGSKNYGAHQL